MVGEEGSFLVALNKKARYIDEDKCTGCGECAAKCPVNLRSDFEQGMGNRSAVHKPYAQAVPGAFSISKMDQSPCTCACPGSVNAHGYVSLISGGKYKEALEVITRSLPMPGILGRICPHPCENACRRSEVDSPVSICTLKRFAADQIDLNELEIPVIEQRPEKVAIIGAGPAGLTAAYFLALEGFQPTIFEALPVAGGMMRVGIPDYRLPPSILEQEVEFITRLGVEIKYNTRIGQDITVDGMLNSDFSSVFIGVGCHKDMKLGLEGEEEISGVIPGVKFLRDVNLGDLKEIKGNVAIVGGGDVAIDAARTALRIGADKVSILYRRTEAEMPARNEEIEDALEEEIDIQILRAPVELVQENGKLTGVRCIQMELGEPDDSGRRRPIPVEGSEFIVEADVLIPAIGQKTDASFLQASDGVELNKWGDFDVNPITYQTSREGVFAGGDAQTGASIAIEAVGAGREAATSISRFLKGEDLAEGREKVEVPQKKFNPLPEKVVKLHPTTENRIPVEQRHLGFDEVELGITEEIAQLAADKCVDCMVCCECFECVKACGAGALTMETHQEQDQFEALKVGSVVLAAGIEPYEPSKLDFYGFDKHANVVTAPQFERLLSASGPTEGHVLRPSDQKEPKKIAWFQCVGSRETNNCDNEYCSSVCCMYAIKEAVIAKEHNNDLDCSIFYMDMRTFGKDFENYYEDAKNKHGINFIRSRVHTIDPVGDSGDLEIRFVGDDGELAVDTFDMIVLSVGMETSPELRELAKMFEIELTPGHFCQTSSLAPVATSRPGVFVSGAFQGPKDIPQSVVDASAAATAVGEILAPARNTLTKAREIIPERDVSGERPRIGVFVCKCGFNIAGTVDVPAVVEYAKDLPYVEYVADNMYSCSQDTQTTMTEIIKENNLNRIVVAACTPKTHEPLFQETLINAGLNRYLFEMVNIRNQASWVHKNDPALATQKAMDLVRMATAKIGLKLPLQEAQLDVNPVAMVIGGGMSGMASALGLARQGFRTHLIEKDDKLGGNAHKLYKTWKGEYVQEMLTDLVSQVDVEDNITVHLASRVSDVKGFVGNFSTQITSGDMDTVIDHGIASLATGAQEHRPDEYCYGEDPRILTSLELDQKFIGDDPAMSDIGCAAFIQCVGSREPGRPYCSRVCCTHTVENALELKQRNPEARVFVLYRDIRTYGERERIYIQARKAGVIFIRYSIDDKPVVALKDGKVSVTVKDHVLGRELEIGADLLTLASAIVPKKDEHLAQLFKVPMNTENFFIERHAKLGPSEFATDGVFLSGLAHYPKPIDEAIAQGQAAASKAVALLSQGTITANGEVAAIDPTLCSGCGVCLEICPFGAPALIDEGRFVSKTQINSVLCKGCGLCVSSCRSGAIRLNGYDNNQILAMLTVA